MSEDIELRGRGKIWISAYVCVISAGLQTSRRRCTTTGFVKNRSASKTLAKSIEGTLSQLPVLVLASMVCPSLSLRILKRLGTSDRDGLALWNSPPTRGSISIGFQSFTVLRIDLCFPGCTSWGRRCVSPGSPCLGSQAEQANSMASFGGHLLGGARRRAAMVGVNR